MIGARVSLNRGYVHAGIIVGWRPEWFASIDLFFIHLAIWKEIP